MMDYYRLVLVPMVLTIILFTTLTTSAPTTTPTHSNNQEDTVTVFVPYDVKFVPVEVPDKLLSVEPLNSVAQSGTSVILKKEDILKHTNNESTSAIKPVATIPAVNNEDQSLNLASAKDPLANEDLVVVPLSTITDALKKQTGSEQLLPTMEVAEPPKKDLVADSLVMDVPHKISKRQAQRRPVFRPLFRFTRLSSNRRRFGPSRNPAMVGYLSDRDYFPTLA